MDRRGRSWKAADVSAAARRLLWSRYTSRLKPWFHVQLLHAIIILGSGRGYRCQSVCVCVMSRQKRRLTISLVAFSCNLTLTVKMITSQVRRHRYYVTWFHQALPLAATLLPHEYLLTRLKACNYCIQELQCVACNNCTWNHGRSGLCTSRIVARWCGQQAVDIAESTTVAISYIYASVHYCTSCTGPSKQITPLTLWFPPALGVVSDLSVTSPSFWCFDYGHVLGAGRVSSNATPKILNSLYYRISLATLVCLSRFIGSCVAYVRAIRCLSQL